MYNMAGTVEETIQWCSAFSPSHMDFRLRMTAWGNGARNTKKLYTITSDSQGVWGPGNSGILLSPFLPHQPFPIQSEWQPENLVASQESSIPNASPMYTSASSPVILNRPNVWHIRICEVKGQERITESCFLEQLVLSLTLFVITSRLHLVRFRPSC